MRTCSLITSGRMILTFLNCLDVVFLCGIAGWTFLADLTRLDACWGLRRDGNLGTSCGGTYASNLLRRVTLSESRVSFSKLRSPVKLLIIITAYLSKQCRNDVV